MSAIAAEREAVIATLQKLMQQRDAQRKVYQSAHTGRQMLTDMSTQQRAEYDQEQARAQQKRLDDVFAARLKRG
jgi:flagellar biosynthesis chaperone FliJ